MKCKSALAFARVLVLCIPVTAGVSPGHGRDGWRAARAQICLAFLMNVIGSVKNI